MVSVTGGICRLPVLYLDLSPSLAGGKFIISYPDPARVYSFEISTRRLEI